MKNSKEITHKRTKTGIEFYDSNDQVIGKYFDKTTGKLRVTGRGITKDQLYYVNKVIGQ